MAHPRAPRSDLLQETDVARIIPGHGPVGTKRELGDLREYMDRIVRRTREMYDAGLSREEAAERLDVGEFVKWPESERNG